MTFFGAHSACVGEENIAKVMINLIIKTSDGCILYSFLLYTVLCTILRPSSLSSLRFLLPLIYVGLSCLFLSSPRLRTTRAFSIDPIPSMQLPSKSNLEADRRHTPFAVNIFPAPTSQQQPLARWLEFCEM